MANQISNFRQEMKNELKEYFDILYEDIKELKGDIKDLKGDIHELRDQLNALNVSRVLLEKGIQQANERGDEIIQVESKIIQMETQVKALKVAGMFIATFFAIVSALSGDLKNLVHILKP